MTIEAVLWIPFFLLSFSLPFDLFMMLSAQTDAVRVVQDANRLASVGRFETPGAAEAYIEAKLQALAAGADAVVTIGPDGVISSTVQFQSSDLGLVGVFSGLIQVTLSAHSEQVMEDFS